MGFVLANVLLALISAGAFWIATRPTGGSRTLTSKKGGRHHRCSANHGARRWVKRQGRRAPSVSR